MFDPIVTAAISFVPTKWDLAGNTLRLVKLIRQAAAATPRPDLILAPEGVLEGYVVADIYDNGVDAKRMRSVALTDDSPQIRELRGLARELAVCLAFGYAEAVGSDTVCNAAMFVDHTGMICGKYHKLQLAEGYVEGNWYNELGQSGRAFDTPLGRVGFLICNDRWNPDLARLPVLDGASLLLVPSFGSCSTAQDEAVLARARENGVAIVEANVGLLLAVSKGEIVARADRSDENALGPDASAFMLLAEVEVPAARTEANYVLWEHQVKEWRGPAMAARWARTLASHGNDAASEYSAAAAEILRAHHLDKLEGSTYTLSDLLAAQRGALESAATAADYHESIDVVAERSLGARTPGSDGDENIVRRLRTVAGSRDLPRVFVECTETSKL